MPWLSTATHAAIIAHPQCLPGVYASTRVSFLNSLGAGFATQCEDHIKLAWCSVVACDLKPYGNSGAQTLAALLAAPAIDCDNYVCLTWHFFKILAPGSPTKVAALGWDGGAIGNHAQMQAQTPGSPDIYLDPTIGLVVHGCSLNGLMGGFTYPDNLIRSFWSYQNRPELNWFENNVRTAIQQTKYRPSDLLYVVGSYERFTTPGAMPAMADWLTPQTQGL